MSEAKRELVRSWLLKARHDLEAAERLAQPPGSLFDVAVYHCQQAAEKALKGYLAFWDQRIERTHDVGLLLDRAQVIEPCFGTWIDAADRLTPLATAYRYPGLIDQPEQEDYDEAIDDARCIVNQVLAFLPPDYHPVPSAADGGS